MDVAVSLRVLVVDDEPLIRWSVRQGLMQRGHTVAEASCGADAVKLIRQVSDRFDVVILDYCLPDSRDLALLDEVCRLTPTSAVVMMTAYADERVRTEAVGRGALAVLGKPFRVPALVSLVESAVRR
jgi:DNA-binding NtrC family response regulator